MSQQMSLIYLTLNHTLSFSHTKKIITWRVARFRSGRKTVTFKTDQTDKG